VLQAGSITWTNGFQLTARRPDVAPFKRKLGVSQARICHTAVVAGQLEGHVPADGPPDAPRS
jgi:hypothetical protein